ncbi:asparaginase [Fictibacillus terranigra]|uniref:Asparaginase n=1 Tax=Fictibacillus terranigra TaxID=3058424 RepID=A0ABT8EDF0_9BACL|nr:asparaginase [Fictibacillus sp. CENA-BCM004]MDN4075956.1 asparaginase [Fictibacillus sp. CENA-BCM004]
MASVKMIEVVRGGRIESTHSGHVAVVNAEGELLYSLGDPFRPTFARSSVKPIQAIPLLESGAAEAFGYDEADIALSCSSHSGEAQHTDRVHAILKRAGIQEEALQCGTHIPRSHDTYKELILAGKELTPLYSNCSGKHTGMLATAKFLGEPLESYFLPEHPVQKRIKRVMSELADFPEDQIGIAVDGCGVPVFELPLERLAFAFARLAKPEALGPKRQKAVERITSAMMKHPEMVGGTGRFCTDFMKTTRGRMFGKAGAESVYCIGDRETGLGIALKMEDGSPRAIHPATVEVLKQLNLLTESQVEELMHHYRPELKNARKETVGEIVASFALQNVKTLINPA